MCDGWHSLLLVCSVYSLIKETSVTKGTDMRYGHEDVEVWRHEDVEV